MTTMKLAIAKEHRDFYAKNGWIEFEGLAKPDLIEKYVKLIDQGAAARLEVPFDRLSFRSSEEQFLAGRDLWRDVPELEPLFRNRSYSEIAAELFFTRPLRLAFMQTLSARHEAAGALKKSSSLLDLIDRKASLKEISCVQGVIGGLLLCLKGEAEVDSTILPKSPGAGVFFRADVPLDLDPLKIPGENRYLLIAYADPISVYILNPSDPHVHFLKKYGYHFGDKLLDRLHPIVYR